MGFKINTIFIYNIFYIQIISINILINIIIQTPNYMQIETQYIYIYN